MQATTIILGGGVTGLAAGLASGGAVYEAAPAPGGICSSYYVRPGQKERLSAPPADGEAYRFDIGGGHWIWGGDPPVRRLMTGLAPARTYARRAAVRLGDDRYVPYPLQDHLRCLGPDVAASALAEMLAPGKAGRTMREWFERHFGPNLCGLFFHPFHELYMAGLYDRIAPQDAFKAPYSLPSVIRGAFGDSGPTGYNVSFLYPAEGLDSWVRQMASRVTLHVNKRAVRIDPVARAVHFADGSATAYDRLLSTLPLSRTVEMAGLSMDCQPDPYVGALVLNVGARKGPRCPREHWLYVPHSRSRFHRVGCYSNVDAGFLPARDRARADRVSLYVERAYPGGVAPSPKEVDAYQAAAIEELTDWGYIGQTEVVDPAYIDVAYTYSWPDSPWRARAMAALEERDIYPVGRFARWVCQGVLESIRDGLVAGAALGALT